MSFWAKLGVTIQDIGCFKLSCEKHGIRYEENQDKNFKQQGLPVHATLTDTQGRNQAYLVRDGGGFKVVVDNDPNYSSITQRLGRNGGKLTRDYAAEVVYKGAMNAGGMINSTTENKDGSVVIRMTRAA